MRGLSLTSLKPQTMCLQSEIRFFEVFFQPFKLHAHG